MDQGLRYMVATSVIKNISGTSSGTDSNMSLHLTEPASSSEAHAFQECPPVLASDQCSRRGRARGGLMVGKQVEESELKQGNMQGAPESSPRAKGWLMPQRLHNRPASASYHLPAQPRRTAQDKH